MSHVFHRQTGQVYPVAALAEGACIVDASGKRYLDASGRPAVIPDSEICR